MEDIYERLTNTLLEKNQSLLYSQARTWVELLWDDFETTRAKAGYKYRGKELTEQIVNHWINQYGDRLHEFVTNNPKYRDYVNFDNGLKH